MDLIAEQKIATIDGKNIAFVECTLKDEKYSYRVLFDDKTKKRFNAFLRAKGFKIGTLADGETVPDKRISI